MTEDRNDDARDDWEFRKMFQSMREINSPAGLDRKCLEVVQKVSGRAGVADPLRTARYAPRLLLPFSIATSLMIGLAIGWALSGQANRSVVDTTTALAPVEFGRPIPNKARVFLGEPFCATSTVDYEVQEGAKPLFTTREFYLCGVGRVQSKSGIQISGEQ
ncbi:MAG: hypothetical protein AAF961_12655 [Planctomycetota bacterium]